MAQEILLITRDDIMKLTGIGGNVDDDSILPHIKTAQDIHLQPIIGTVLYEKILAISDDGTWKDTVNEAYAELIVEYIAPVLTYYTMVDFLPFELYKIQNGSVYRHQSDNSIVSEPTEVNSLVQRFKDKAEFYQGRMNDFICANSNDYPEYNQNKNGDMSPDSQDTFNGWQI